MYLFLLDGIFQTLKFPIGRQTFSNFCFVRLLQYHEFFKIFCRNFNKIHLCILRYILWED